MGEPSKLPDIGTVTRSGSHWFFAVTLPRLFTLVTLSLLFWIWWRSDTRADRIDLRISNQYGLRALAAYSWLEVDCQSSSVPKDAITFTTSLHGNHPPRAMYLLEFPAYLFYETSPYDKSPWPWHRLWTYVRDTAKLLRPPEVTSNSISMRIPYWSLAVVAVVPLVPSELWRRRRQRRMSGSCCSRCGYDLRATPNRCPECGTVPRKPRDRATIPLRSRWLGAIGCLVYAPLSLVLWVCAFTGGWGRYTLVYAAVGTLTLWRLRQSTRQIIPPTTSHEHTREDRGRSLPQRGGNATLDKSMATAAQRDIFSAC